VQELRERFHSRPIEFMSRKVADIEWRPAHCLMTDLIVEPVKACARRPMQDRANSKIWLIIDFVRSLSPLSSCLAWDLLSSFNGIHIKSGCRLERAIKPSYLRYNFAREKTRAAASARLAMLVFVTDFVQVLAPSFNLSVDDNLHSLPVDNAADTKRLTAKPGG